MQRAFAIVVLSEFLVGLTNHCSQAAITGLQRLAVGHALSAPAFATHAPGDLNRLFVAELGGDIEILDLNNLSAAPVKFLDITDTNAGGEGGLLGLAFHPNYSAPVGTTGRGKFYVYVTVSNSEPVPIGGGEFSPFSTHIREYTVSGDPVTSNMADASSKREILKFIQPQSNHNAGWIGFNPITPAQPQQYLYIASGDGGNGNDVGNGHTEPGGNAQDITDNLLGKMLRIDINGDDFPADPNRNYAIPPSNPFFGVAGDDEIWSYGLRNPYRDSFDRATGDLWIGDVGQGAREEIDFQPASSTGGENYGWRLREGTIQTPGSVGGSRPPGNVDPIYDYQRGAMPPPYGPFEGRTVIGGYRYRGPDPDLQGGYIFGDYVSRNVWQMNLSPFQVTNINASLNNLAGIDNIVSFAEDAIGRLYIVDVQGEVYRILTTPTTGDFNRDNIINFVDIDELARAAREEPNNLAYDLNGDGSVTFAANPSGMGSDSDKLVRQLVDIYDRNGRKVQNGSEYADFDLDGEVFLGDLDIFATNWNMTGPFGWADGNVDGDSEIFLGDLDVFATHWRHGVGSGAALAEVPEPHGWLLMLYVIFSRIHRKRRDKPISLG
jgi:glucose/arabinose dehydrogenase